MPSWILLVALLALWPLIQRYFVARKFSGWRFAHRTYTLVERSEVPQHLLELMNGQAWQLEQLGFQYQTSFRHEAPLVPDELSWTLVYLEAGTGVYALVELSEDVARLGLADLAFITFFSDEKVLLTTSRDPGAQGDHPKMERIVARIDELLEVHRGRVEVYETVERGPLTFSPPDLAEVLAAYLNQHLDILVSEKRLKPGRRPDTWHMSFAEAWKTAGRALKSAAAVKKKEAAEQRIPAGPPPIPVTPQYRDALAEFEVDMFFYCRKLSSVQGGTAWDKLIILVVSIGLFLLWLGFEASIQTIAIIFAVLLVHESGHLLGMWMFRYRNLQMLFLPFFGAVAIGAREQVKPWQELIVLLLGPIPGLVAGIGIWIGMGPYEAMPPWLQETVVTLLLLNGFNLLPIYPMDGGQLVRLAFFTRFPRLGALFSLISALVLLGLGLLAGTWILSILAAMMLMNTAKNFRAADIVNSVREVMHNPAQVPERDVARAVLARIPATISNLKFQLATPPFTALRTPMAGFGTAAIVALLYLSPLWLPLAAWPILQWQGDERLKAARAELEKLLPDIAATGATKPTLLPLQEKLTGRSGVGALPLSSYAYASLFTDDDLAGLKKEAASALDLPSTSALLGELVRTPRQLDAEKITPADWEILSEGSSLLTGAALLEMEKGDRAKSLEYLIGARRLQSLASVDIDLGFGDLQILRAFQQYLLQDWATEEEIQRMSASLERSPVSLKSRIDAILTMRILEDRIFYAHEVWSLLGKTPLKAHSHASYLEASIELAKLRDGTEQELRELAEKSRKEGESLFGGANSELAQQIESTLGHTDQIELLQAALECYQEHARSGKYPDKPSNAAVRWKKRPDGGSVLVHERLPETEFAMRPAP